MTEATGSHAPDGDHGGDGHADDALHGLPQAALKDYFQGFVLSVILTSIPFWLVMAKVIPSPGITIVIILGLAIFQIIVHVIYFLHMSPKVEGGWSVLALIFTLVLVVIALAGSLWVMYHLNHNMMPVSPQQMRDMP
jgi:cytochrome o ubiquinol oxidase operon protein cyoD